MVRLTLSLLLLLATLKPIVASSNDDLRFEGYSFETTTLQNMDINYHWEKRNLSLQRIPQGKIAIWIDPRTEDDSEELLMIVRDGEILGFLPMNPRDQEYPISVALDKKLTPRIQVIHRYSPRSLELRRKQNP